ncbi:MAG: long-chain fatty acid--CoA ligase [Deltaproteobacteria bacterium]|nr:long-chain fatty acid--CoA ligase [Deltaproteobacteria bacterium]
MANEIHYSDKVWVKKYDEGVPENIDYEEICMPDYLEKAAEEFPNNTALTFQGYRISYGRLKDMVDRLATCLTDFGLKKGERVAILLPNIIHCVAAYYATLKLGAVTVMGNPLSSDKELEYQFNDSGAKVLITIDLVAKRMIELRSKTLIKQIIYGSIGDYLPFPVKWLFPLVGRKKGLAARVDYAPEVYKWKEIIALSRPNPPKIEVTFEDIAMLQYTGGTTGVSKGVILTHANISKQVQQLITWLHRFKKKRGSERNFGALPFFHVFGLSCSMNYGIAMAWENILIPKPQPAPLVEAITKYRPTLAPLVPTMFIGILNHPKVDSIDMRGIKGCFSGSAPLPIEVMKKFEEKTGSTIVEGFGMTESSPVTHVNPFDGERKPGSIGLPVPDTECRIVDIEDKDREVPVGETGELTVKGPQVMKGYWNMPEETAKVLRNGWLYTGDIARMDEDGYFYIVDRLKDMVLSGGLNVYPREIDEVFYEYPKIEDACAIGIPHETRGESIKVFVVLKQGEEASVEELMEYCKTKLATYKLPVEIEFRKELPKSSVGKVLRKDLRAEEMKKRKGQ